MLHIRQYIRGVSGEPSIYILIYSFIWSALKLLVFNYITDHAHAHYKIFLALDHIIIVKEYINKLNWSKFRIEVTK